MEAERILAVASQFNLDGITRTRGDLIFTTSRIIFVKTVGSVDLTESVFGFLGRLIASSRSRRISDELSQRPLEQLLTSPAKVADHRYVELERITIKARGVRRSVVIVYPRNGRGRKYWGKRKDLLQMLEAIPEVRTHGAPVSE